MDAHKLPHLRDGHADAVVQRIRPAKCSHT
jgi:hypothetical protein